LNSRGASLELFLLECNFGERSAATALRRALVSYLLDAVVLAISVNLVASLSHLGG